MILYRRLRRAARALMFIVIAMSISLVFAVVREGRSSAGSARYYGSVARMRLSRPIVGMAASHSGVGYWLVASDGGIFTFGSARFWGSTGGHVLNAPVVGMAGDPHSQGYWLVTQAGNVYSYGGARFLGSPG